MAKVKYNANWTKVQKADYLTTGLLELSTDIHRRAIILAPVETGALKSSGIIEKITDGFRIKFGGGRVPYARRRHFENKKNPQTLRYLARAGDSVIRGNTDKYFRNKI